MKTHNEAILKLIAEIRDRAENISENEEGRDDIAEAVEIANVCDMVEDELKKTECAHCGGGGGMSEIKAAREWLERALERDMSEDGEAAEAREDIKTALALLGDKA